MNRKPQADRPNIDSDALDVSRLLEQLGMSVEFVPRCDTKSCDLRAWDEHERYLVEVKAFHNPETTKTGSSFLLRQRSHIDTVRDRTAKGNKQLRATASRYEDALRLQAWIRRSPYAPEVHQMILGALYGARLVLQTDADGRDSQNVCLYFSHSDFFKYWDRLDGVIVLDSGRGELHLNDHSDHFVRIQQSLLAQAFLQKKALRDAITIGNERGYLIADCDVDRNDGAAVCEYLERKYRLKRVISMFSLGF